MVEKQPGPFQTIAPDHERLGADEVPEQEGMGQVPLPVLDVGAGDIDLFSVFDSQEGAIDGADRITGLFEEAHLLLEFPGQPFIVAVMERDVLSAGGSDTGVPRRGRALVGVVPEVADAPIGKPLDGLPRPVRRGVVDDDQFEILKALIEDATHRAAEEPLAIVGRYDDANFGWLIAHHDQSGLVTRTTSSSHATERRPKFSGSSNSCFGNISTSNPAPRSRSMKSLPYWRTWSS